MYLHLLRGPTSPPFHPTFALRRRSIPSAFVPQTNSPFSRLSLPCSLHFPAHATIASRARRVVFRIDRGKQSGGRAILSCSGRWIAERTDLGFPYKRIGYDSSMSAFPTGAEGRLRPYRLCRVAGYQHPPYFRDLTVPAISCPSKETTVKVAPVGVDSFYPPPRCRGAGNYEIGAARMGKFRFNREDSLRRRLKSQDRKSVV